MFFKYGSFKDEWENTKFYQHIYGPELIIKSIKTRSDFRLGIDEKGIYLSTDFRHTENLKNMDDKFWIKLLNLMEFEGFEYDEYEFIGDETRHKHPELFKNYKGMIFRMFRKYFFSMIEYKEVGTLGDFKITWTNKIKFDDIIREGCIAFRIMYQLNYDLWKIDDLKNKKAVANAS